MELDLRGRLVAADVTGTRVSWTDRPSGDGLPAIVLQIAAGTRGYTLKGPRRRQQSRVQMDIFAANYPDLLQLKAAAIAAVEPPASFGGTVFGPAIVNIDQDMPLETLSGGGRAFRRMIDFSIWHRPA